MQAPWARGHDGIDGRATASSSLMALAAKGQDRPHINFAVVRAIMVRAGDLALGQHIQRSIIEDDFRVGEADVDDGDAAW